MNPCLVALLFWVCTSPWTFASLVIKQAPPKQAGSKVVVKLTMKNTFAERVESARATAFLMDAEGKVVGRATQWVIGGTKDQPALAPDKSSTYHLVIQADKPFTRAEVIFNQIILESGRISDLKNAYSIELEKEKEKQESNPKSVPSSPR
jgi:hypothetical protein